MTRTVRAMSKGTVGMDAQYARYHLDALARALSSDRLHLILMPTEKCNFRCVYCYEDFLQGKMPQSVWSGVYSLLDKRIEELKELEISWFGGEPLLNYNLIVKTSRYITDLLVQKNIKCNYRASMSTNGSLLTLKRLDELSAIGVKTFQISLDGTEKFHDNTRVKVNKTGSFFDIWNNLISFKDSDSDFEISLRIHVHQKNIADIEVLCDRLLKIFGDDDRFRVFFKAIEKLGANESGLSLMGRSADDVISKFKRKIEGTTLHVEPSRYKSYCYASHANSFVIRSNGDVAKCTVDFNNPANKLGKLTSNGGLLVSNDLLRLWVQGILEGGEHSAKCPLGLVNKEYLKIPTAIKIIHPS